MLKMTNYKLIQNMSIEELANFLCNLQSNCNNCPVSNKVGCIDTSELQKWLEEKR